MCAVRNQTGPVGKRRGILDHWEMCAVRNLAREVDNALRILDHWEMCAVRNYVSKQVALEEILDHWEMCDVRNVIKRQAQGRSILDHREICATWSAGSILLEGFNHHLKAPIGLNANGSVAFRYIVFGMLMHLSSKAHPTSPPQTSNKTPAHSDSPAWVRR